MHRVTVIILLAILIAGCASGQINSDAGLPGNDKAIVVVGVTVTGVQPDEVKIYLWPGSLDKDVFSQSNWYGAQAVASPENDYVVSEVDAGETLALSQVKVSFDKEAAQGLSESGSSLFVPRGGTVTATFNVSSGKVIYVGDIVLHVTPPELHTLQSGSLIINHTYDLAAATKFIESRFPAFKGQLIGQPFVMAKFEYPILVDINPFLMAHRIANPVWVWKN